MSESHKPRGAGGRFVPTAGMNEDDDFEESMVPQRTENSTAAEAVGAGRTAWREVVTGAAEETPAAPRRLGWPQRDRAEEVQRGSPLMNRLAAAAPTLQATNDWESSETPHVKPATKDPYVEQTKPNWARESIPRSAAAESEQRDSRSEKRGEGKEHDEQGEFGNANTRNDSEYEESP